MTNPSETHRSIQSPGIYDDSYDYSYVPTTARIAVYDDFHSAPRVIDIAPDKTAEYIERLTSSIYDLSTRAGGKIPYTIIREVTENFIHSRFQEVVVSIYNNGNTIRFADQGPGIEKKDKVHLPGFTSAIEPMKKYIRGVGSGLPIVKEYLDFSKGKITIEDNIRSGAVITVTMADENIVAEQKTSISSLTPPLAKREKEFLSLFIQEGVLGVTDIVNIAGYPQSTTHVTLKKMEESGLIEKTIGQKRMLTDLGFQIASSF